MSTDRTSPLAHQSLGRELTAAERELGAALSRIFATGEHDFAAVAAALGKSGVARPSGTAGAWSAAALEEELSRINASLDQAYAEHGIGA
ncbi:MAG TPA: recombinase-like helix-turn-helix domain-containing protein [Hyphomicrobiales bacterium]|nr:recombinase-like helix-turn-helix domain-containing protein [Hyphomicrobiales bacterium]